MTADALTLHLGELGAVLTSRMPRVLDATAALLESVLPPFEGFERYELQHQIGLGGHAEVFLGVVHGSDGFQRQVAIKRVRADLTGQRPFVRMLIEEAHHAARLFHPNVVSVLDFVRDAEGRPYLIM